MRLGWTKNKSSTTYRVVKTIRVNKKNKTLPRNQIGTGLRALLRAKEPLIPSLSGSICFFLLKYKSLIQNPYKVSHSLKLDLL